MQHAKDANLVILTYAINKKTSFENLDQWLEALNIDEKGRSLKLALIATKKDLASCQRSISVAQGKQRQQNLGQDRCLMFAETSSFEDVSELQTVF